MKKTAIAAGVIVALGIVWTSAAWYTGKQFEARLSNIVTQGNEQLKSQFPNAGLELSYQNYQRGIFSSQLQLILRPLSDVQNSWLMPGQSLVLKENVDHGPFPFAQLKKSNLIPSLASVQTTLVNNALTGPLFEMATGESPVRIDTRVGYSGASTSDIVFQPIHFKKAQTTLLLNGGKFTVSVDREGNTVSLKGGADSAQYDSVNAYGQRIALTLNALKTDGTSSLTSFDARIGQQKSSLGKLVASVEGKELATFKGMTLTAGTELANGKKQLNSAIDYTIDSLEIQNQDMGSGRLHLKIDQIDGQAWHQFSQRYNAQMNALLTNPNVPQHPDAFQDNVNQIVFANLPLLLKNNPTVTLAPLSWKNTEGESTLNLSLMLQDGNCLQSQSVGEMLLRDVKSLDGNMTIPVEMAIAFMTRVSMLEGYQEKKAQERATTQVQSLSALGQGFHLISQTNDRITSTLHYTNGRVTLNGKDMPVDSLLGALIMPGTIMPSDAPDSRK